MERASEEEQNDTNFSFVAPSSEEFMSAEVVEGDTVTVELKGGREEVFGSGEEEGAAEAAKEGRGQRPPPALTAVHLTHPLQQPGGEGAGGGGRWLELSFIVQHTCR